ncbi:hypothetical protein [Arthrobacter sp. HLT1-21]
MTTSILSVGGPIADAATAVGQRISGDTQWWLVIPIILVVLGVGITSIIRKKRKRDR